MYYSHLVTFFSFKFMNLQNGFVKYISDTMFLITKGRVDEAECIIYVRGTFFICLLLQATVNLLGN